MSEAKDGPGQDLRRVFVSHSREDRDGQLFLYHLFNRPESKFQPYFYSVEPTPPHAKPIRDWIRRSEAMFVLLSKAMLESHHTHSWTGYEIGIAAEKEIPVVVIEPGDEPVELPVPGATVYLQRPATIPESLPSMWQTVMETACHLKPREPLEMTGKLGDDIMSTLANLATSSLDSTGNFHTVLCENPKCQAPFWVPVEIYQGRRHPCPTCRSEVASYWVKTNEFFEEAQKGTESKMLSGSYSRPALSTKPGLKPNREE